MFKVGLKVYCKSMKANMVVVDYIPENEDVLCIDFSEEGEMTFFTYWIKPKDLEYGWEKDEKNNTDEVKTFCKKFEDKLLNTREDLVSEIKCPDGVYRTRPLMDIAHVLEIMRDIQVGTKEA